MRGTIFQQCLADVLEDKEVRKSLIDSVFMLECLDRHLSEGLSEMFLDLPSAELASHLISGYSKEEASKLFKSSLSLISKVENGGDFAIHPIPNLYFQRDPAMTVGCGIVIGQMTYEVRRREPLYWKYITNHHPRFKGMEIIFGDAPDEVWPHKVEGGDLLVLSDMNGNRRQPKNCPDDVQRIGKTRAEYDQKDTREIPRERYCMHLDTVFTMVDNRTFTIFPTVIKVLKVWEMDYDDNGTLLSIKRCHHWKEAIAQELGFDTIRVIEMRGKDQAETDREQWHDGCNTLAVAPGKVVTYNRNLMSNRLLRENGIEVLELNGPELGRGRGGPRCMTMPLNRGPVK